MWELQATAMSKHYLRFIITSRKNIFKQLSLRPFSVTNLVIKVRQKAGVTKISFAIYKINQLPTKLWAKNAAFFPIAELQRPSNMPCLAMDQTRDEYDWMHDNTNRAERLHTSSRNGNALLGNSGIK